MKRMALYARVSTRRQVQEATIESQLEQLQQYAQQQGHRIPPAQQYIDQAVSGKHLARPGLDRLRDAAAQRAFEVLLCLHPDRLARNLGAQQVVLDELQRAGIQVIFIQQPALDNSPQAQLLLNIQGAFAEYERVLISDRMRRGKLYRLRHGQLVPHQAPYGYQYQPATSQHAAQWVIVPAEAPIVEQMFSWYTHEALSLRALAQRLNQQHVPSPRGARWNGSSVQRILRQPAYKGTAYYNRHQTDYSAVGQLRRQGRGALRFPRYKPRPVEEWIEIAVPVIIPEAVWHAAQERLEMNMRFAQRNTRHCYLLRSLLVCSVCGYTLQGRTQRGVVYYACTHGGQRRPPGIPQHTCSLRGDVVESLIWQALTALLQQPQQIQEAWHALHAETTVATTERARWQQRQTALRKQRQRLLDAYQADALTLDELQERQNPLDVELHTLTQRIAATTTTAPPPIALDTFTQRIQHALAASDPQTQQEVIRLLIERIVVSDEALTVEHIIPTLNLCRLHPTYSDTCSSNFSRFTSGQNPDTIQILGNPLHRYRA